MTTQTKALALYAKACESHKRADWRLACHALAAVLQAGDAPAKAPTPIRASTPKPARASRVPSLCEFLAKQGGLHDAGGELRARDAELWHKGRPFMPRLVKPGGLSLESAAEIAWEHGYFPGAVVDWNSDANMHPVTGDDLLAAIDRELAGRPTYPGDLQPTDSDELSESDWSAYYGERAA